MTKHKLKKKIKKLKEELENLKYPEREFQYYKRCYHGITLEYCTLCTDPNSHFDLIPKPFKANSYTYEECLRHLQPCKCDGCLVYSIHKPNFNAQ